jgi:hypothetical protein
MPIADYKCTSCGRPRFIPGLCLECQDKQDSQIAAVYTKLNDVSNGLTCLYELDSCRVEELSGYLTQAEEALQTVKYHIRELQTQVALYQMLTTQQKQIIEDAKMCFRGLQKHGLTPHIIRGFIAALKIEEETTNA